MYLRRYLLRMCIDVEHALKVKLIADIEKDTDQDGYQIVSDFLKSNEGIKKSIAGKEGTIFAGDLVSKYFTVGGDRPVKFLKDVDCPAWVLVELLSFGAFIRFANAFNVRNCLISLKTGRTAEHDKKYMISKLAPVTYDENAKCPRWGRFIEEITCGDKSLQLYLQRMIGYCMTAYTKEQCMFFLYGNGSNGKSVFVDTIAYMLGEYAASCQPETVMMRDRNNTARGDLARLKGARMVVTSEPNDGCRLDEGKLVAELADLKEQLQLQHANAQDFRDEILATVAKYETK